MARTEKTSNFHEKCEYHFDITVTTIKDNMTKYYVLFISVTISKYVLWNKKIGWIEAKIWQKAFLVFGKMKKNGAHWGTKGLTFWDSARDQTV